MHVLEIDEEIKITKEAIKELEESKDFEALDMACADLAYLISLLTI